MNQKKLEANSVLYSQLNKSEKKFILKQDLSDLKILINYIPNLLECLWENPKLVADLIINSDLKDVKETLSYLFMNNFYENILSTNNIENNLIYLLTLLVKDEINNLENINELDKFLNEDSKVLYFLSELRKKNDVKYFFKTSILNLISDLESMSSVNLSLEIQEIINKLTKNTNTEKGTISNISSIKVYGDELYNRPTHLEEPVESSIFHFDQIISKKVEENEGILKLKSKYLSTLTLSYFKQLLSQYNSTNPDMFDYLNNIINNSNNENNSNDENLFSNCKLMTKFDINKDLSDKLILHYIITFYYIKDFIDKLISILKKNLILLPYPVKSLCKIISVLIQKKFKNINTPKKNAFISRFFFEILIRPILSEPGIELLINNYIISGYTLSNLSIINEILSKLFSFELFLDNDDVHNNNYTPFNWYFLEKTPEILEIFNKLIDIDLPPFIDDLINDKLDPNFSYDYFSLNKEEVIIHYSKCFSFRDLLAIIKGFENLKNKVDIKKYKDGKYILKTFERLNSEKNRTTLSELENQNNYTNTLCNNKESEKEIKKRNSIKNKEKENYCKKELNEINTENYYLIQKLIINNEYKELNNNLQLDSKNNFYIKEEKSTTQNESKNIIIKFKNFLSDLLYNISPLKKINFSQCNITNTYEILNSIKNHTKLSTYNFNDTIPPEWYIESLLNIIKNIPEDYNKNDLEKLYDEIEEEINISINSFNIDFLNECLNKMQLVKKEKEYFEEMLNILKDLELNEKVKKIVEEDFIPVKIIFNYDDKNHNFDIKKSKLKKDEFRKKEIKESKISKNNIMHCNSIKSFINKFPDFSEFQEKQDIDIFEMQNKLLVPQKMREYFFSIIHDHLLKDSKEEKEDDLVQKEYKIYDYVMSKIYQKIFPKIYEEDDKLFTNIFKLSWTEPKHFIKGKNNYIFDAFLPEVIEKFGIMDNVESPRKKILSLDEIFNSISKLVKFNGGDNMIIGVDDQMPILGYCLIKAQPNRIGSNLEFIKLYRKSLLDEGNDIQFTQLVALITFIKNIDYKKLNGITEEEYNKKCNEVINVG